MLKEELFKKVIECKNALVNIGNKMSNTTDSEEKKNLESKWAEVFEMQQSYITAIENIDKQEKYKTEINEQENTIEIEKTQEENKIKLPLIEEKSTQDIDLPPIEENNETPIEEEKIIESDYKEEVPEIPTEGAQINDEEVIKEDTNELEEKTQVNEGTSLEENKIVFINETSNPTPGKKISVNETQFEKLSNSLKEQSAIIAELYNTVNNPQEISSNEESSVITSFNGNSEIGEETSNNDLDPEKQMEEMLNQQRQLIAEGKAEEAEAMTEQISAYTKKISGIAA